MWLSSWPSRRPAPGHYRDRRAWNRAPDADLVELDAEVTAVAAGLVAHGLVAGHRVALFGPEQY